MHHVRAFLPRLGDVPEFHRRRPVILDAASIEAVALRVVELLRDDTPLIPAADVARRLGRSREWVYRHAEELGAVPLGDGERPRLGFERAKVAAYSAGSRPQQRAQPSPERSARRRATRSNGQGGDLLPIRGGKPR
jgi:hypothetical protein